MGSSGLGERLVEAVTLRFTEPPMALKAHAFLVLSASVLLIDIERADWWFGPAVILILLWPLLRGSLFVWLVHMVGLGMTLLIAVGKRDAVLDCPPGFSFFLDAPTYVAYLVAVAGALLLLLLPSVRRYCDRDPAPRSAIVTALGAFFVSSFPTMALGLDSHVPWPPQLEDTKGARFVWGDDAGPVAFYVADRGEDLCLLVTQPRSNSRSCGDASHLVEYSSPRYADDVLAGLAPEEAERVVVETLSGPRTARLVEVPGTDLDLYYLVGAPGAEVVDVFGYDARGRELFKAGDY